MNLLVSFLTGLLVFVLLLFVPSALGANLPGAVEMLLCLGLAIAAGVTVNRRRKRAAA